MSFLSKIMCHWAQSTANLSWSICRGLSSRTPMCTEHPATFVTQYTLFLWHVLLSLNQLKWSVQQGNYSTDVFFSVAYLVTHACSWQFLGTGYPGMWQWRTASDMMKTAKHPSRMVTIHLNLGCKLLAFCFLKLCHRIAFLNGAHKTPCSLCLLACWRR